MDDLLVYTTSYDNRSFPLASSYRSRTGVSTLSSLKEKLSTEKNCSCRTVENFSKQWNIFRLVLLGWETVPAGKKKKTTQNGIMAQNGTSSEGQLVGAGKSLNEREKNSGEEKSRTQRTAPGSPRMQTTSSDKIKAGCNRRWLRRREQLFYTGA